MFVRFSPVKILFHGIVRQEIEDWACKQCSNVSKRIYQSLDGGNNSEKCI